MIRTTGEASVFSLWRDAALLGELVDETRLTTARYEPVCRNLLGSGHVDLLFESTQRSCVISGIRLDPNSLVTRERSPFIWPAYLPGIVDAGRLSLIEGLLTPWLRSLARARPMAEESVRRFCSSGRFDRARVAELLGAAPLERVMRHMAPFVYARRFAAGREVWIESLDEALGNAVLGDLAASVAYADSTLSDDPMGDRSFARDWYGVEPHASRQKCTSDLLIEDRRGSLDAAVVIEVLFQWNSSGATVEVPSPAPLDLLFSFDPADAPAMSRFSVHAVEPPLRPCPPLVQPEILGGSAGRIVLAMSAEALALRGADVEEAETLKRYLVDAGLTVSIATDIADRNIPSAELVHIFGGAFEAHTVAFGQAARDCGIDYIFDLPPKPRNTSAYLEEMLVVALRSASDDAERARYLDAYEGGRTSGTTAAEANAEEYARVEARFAELAAGAVAILAFQEDVEELRARLGPHAAAKVLLRGVFASPEPEPAAIGHLVPTASFAFVHAPISARSHALFTACAAEKCGVPLVIAGLCYDVEYLQTLRTISPGAVVLADANAAVIAAIYRRAKIWIDAAPRPRSAAGLVRATACGALPILALESPLARVAGPDALAFGLTSFESAAAVILDAMELRDHDLRITALRSRLSGRRDPGRTFNAMLGAYARVASAV